MARIVKFTVGVFRPRNKVGSRSLPRSQCACLSEV
jgi:hypothetical protein